MFSKGQPGERVQVMPTGRVAVVFHRPAFDELGDLAIESAIFGLSVKFKRGDVVQMSANHPSGDRKVASHVPSVGDKLLPPAESRITSPEPW